jgi:hypothetical protein
MASPPWTNAWDEAKPADNDLASSLGTQGRQLKLDVRQRLAYQHVWSKDINTDGAHINLILSDADTLANKEILRAGGYSLTGANAQAMVELSGTWNTTGNPTLLRFNVNDTASNPAALLFDLQKNGASQFRVSKTGGVPSMQVVQQSTTVNTALGTSFGDVSSLQVPITPTKASSRIRLQVTAAVQLDVPSGSQAYIELRVTRGTGGGVTVATYGVFALTPSGGARVNETQQVAFDCIDSPNTTSNTTYQVAGRYVNVVGLAVSASVNPTGFGANSAITATELP